MKLPVGDEQRLEQMLDAAGRAAQPAHPGWETLVARATAQPQFRPAAGVYRFVSRYTAAAAVLLVALGSIIWLLIPSGGLPDDRGGPKLWAEDKVKVERLPVEMTMLSSEAAAEDTLFSPHAARPKAEKESALRKHALMAPGEHPHEHSVPAPASEPRRSGLGGLALVKDHRILVNLQDGENLVRFRDVAATLDPTSVHFVSHTDPKGTQVLEQSFEYDLATADTLLRRYLERSITCIDASGKEITGTLLAFDADTLVIRVAKEPAPHSLARAELQAIRLDALPEGLVVRPTLVWKLRARTPGRHETTLSYLCGEVSWQADYIAHLMPGGSAEAAVLDFQGWVTVDNRSGAAFPEAGLKLLAGNVNRVRDPWAPPRHKPKPDEDDDEFKVLAQRDPILAQRFSRKPLFDYHLYTLQGATSVRDRQVKQLHLLQTYGVQATKRYVYDFLRDSKRVVVQLHAKNTQENNLGLPLPAGRVTVQQTDADGAPIFLGRDEIGHTALNEELALLLGYAYDLGVERRQTMTPLPTTREQEFKVEIRLRSQKSEPVTVRCLAPLAPQARWEVKQATDKWQSLDGQTLYFDVLVQPGKETLLQYTIHYAF